MADLVTSTAAPAPAADAANAKAFNVMTVSGEMVLLTWATFLAATILLFKLAWKPILQALAKREDRIRGSLAEADKARALAARTQENNRKLLDEAQRQAREIVDEARRAAGKSAADADRQARDSVKRMLADADRDIARARAEALEALRRESAALAVDLADRFLERETPPEARAAYTARMMRELKP